MSQEQNDFLLPSPLQEFSWPSSVRNEFESRNLSLLVKRDDLIHPIVSGNKWRKLRLNIEQAKAMGKTGLLSFGGAYSNHILALAKACQMAGMKSIGIIRGEELNATSNDNLKRCAEWGMDLQFISREEYFLKDDWDYLNEMKSEFSSYYIVPEGGKNFYGTIGCQDISKELPDDLDALWLAAGTCTTAAGLALSLPEHIELNVVPVLKGFDGAEEVKKLIRTQFHDEDLANEVVERIHFHSDYHFGGYGKETSELISFMNMVEKDINLPLESVYTGKTFFAMLNHYRLNSDLTNQTIVFLHTGGLENKKGQN